MCDPILVTLLKMQPYYSQFSRENGTPSSGTSPVASYNEVPPPPPGRWRKYCEQKSVKFGGNVAFLLRFGPFFYDERKAGQDEMRWWDVLNHAKFRLPKWWLNNNFSRQGGKVSCIGDHICRNCEPCIIMDNLFLPVSIVLIQWDVLSNYNWVTINICRSLLRSQKNGCEGDYICRGLGASEFAKKENKINNT